ncbi:hemerythrin domain-containing protein [archaeon]|nr:MAG: hemerythrin domain-containing protein [archaeon]
MATSKYHLTSKAVSENPDGKYPFQVTEFLIPHEALRREMDRAIKALSSITNIAAEPWKVEAFAKWFTEYFAPAVHEHHDLEEKVVVPFYQNLGAQPPAKTTADHGPIVQQLDAMVRKVQEIRLVVRMDAANRTAAVSLAALRDEFHSFVSTMEDHLAEEETAWPPIYLQYGKQKADECVQQILSVGAGHQVFEIFAGAVFNAMGIKIGGIEPCYPGEKGWACPEMQAEFMHEMPLPVRLLLLPGWNKQFQRYKALIYSVITSQHDPSLLNDYYSCACIIS